MSEYTLKYKCKFYVYICYKVLQIRIKLFFTQWDNTPRISKLHNEVKLLEKRFKEVYKEYGPYE